ncbi:UDP-N-acetylglucosamine pyrophosphorylase [Paenibacillus castaneae]|uniref:UTP--glucose-1-phosphate uridylyltransferase n=1 Tax=Paenibacillus castaneae TaxID=474957 RepID=UPI000C9CC68D|nr:UDPGP type 1 family protein [Paenibacillus castaneae]NIK78872.1 UDP-N-acetylglucosamine pyrophosphorylase [Paenibacillus castaneae]
MDNCNLDCETKAKLLHYKQEHLLCIMETLSINKKNKLMEQLKHIDFEQLMTILQQKDQQKIQSPNVTPIHYEEWDDYGEKEQDAFTQKGMELLHNGEIGVIVVAGGQGSRLGHDGPKGTFDIGLPSGKSLFQLQGERLLNLSTRAGKSIPWYIMTSPENHKDTLTFFQASHYFGYPPEDCFFFQQNTMPALDHEGKLLLSPEGLLQLAPSGNGECFSSLKRSGALADMKKRGINWLFYCNVDNALIQIADPAFIGAAAEYNHPIATKVIEKTNVDEKIGILCLNDNRSSVLEYNEIPEDLRNEKDENGRLRYHLGNISIHLFRIDFIEEHADTEIPFHIASKRMDCMDAEGRSLSPDEPNAYKLERFIFDFFPLAEQMTVLMGLRNNEFAPVKNKEGEDSPESARKLVFKLHREWLMAAGVPLEKLPAGDIEISPLLSYGGEGLNSRSVKELLEKD